MWVSTAVLAVLSMVGAVFAPQIIAIFRGDDPQVIQIGTATLRLQCISFPLMGWVILCNMLLQNIALTVKASVVAAARQGLFFIPLILILPQTMGLFGVEVCQTVSDLCSFALSLVVTLPVLAAFSRLEREKAAGNENNL